MIYDVRDLGLAMMSTTDAIHRDLSWFERHLHLMVGLSGLKKRRYLLFLSLILPLPSILTEYLS